MKQELFQCVLAISCPVLWLCVALNWTLDSTPIPCLNSHFSFLGNRGMENNKEKKSFLMCLQILAHTMHNFLQKYDRKGWLSQGTVSPRSAGWPFPCGTDQQRLPDHPHGLGTKQWSTGSGEQRTSTGKSIDPAREQWQDRLVIPCWTWCAGQCWWREKAPTAWVPAHIHTYHSSYLQQEILK